MFILTYAHSRTTALKICATICPMQAGARVGGYAFETSIGSGATGQVYRCRDLATQEKVAVKVLRREVVADKSRMALISREVDIHRSIGCHRRILRFIRSFQDDGLDFIVTELCSGSTLFSYLLHNCPTGMIEMDARPIIADLADALCFLHAHGVLHRDLKLSNLLLDDDRQVKIADFGLAIRAKDAATSPLACGTPNYIAPEILAQAPYTQAADCWSLGCVMVALLTGKPPFQGEQVAETLHLVSKAAYRPLPRASTKKAKMLVHALLSLDASARPTAAEVLKHAFVDEASRITEVNRVSDSFIEKYRFSTEGVKPTKQRIKGGKITVSADGNLTVERENHSLDISADGSQISTGSTSYTLDDLPARYLPTYRAAAKAISQLQKRAVLIALESASCKCRLFNDGRFECVLISDGFKVSFGSASRKVKLANREKVLWRGCLDDVPRGHLDPVRQAMIWHGRCCEASGCKQDYTSTVHPSSVRRFVREIGWCETEGGIWHFLFLDGVSLELRTVECEAILTEGLQPSKTFALKAGVKLPREVKTRLKQCRRAMQEFV
ncbi:hypothetical protein PYCC9005_003978 [Savitreella phatthalungensis]